MDLPGEAGDGRAKLLMAWLIRCVLGDDHGPFTCQAT
jgi:hypothetical protein